MVTYEDTDYLVLTVHDPDTDIPSVCLYAVKLNIARIMPGSASLRIPGAEIFCGINHSRKSISYLTNSSLESYFSTKDGSYESKFARLQSTSHVGEVSIDLLTQMQSESDPLVAIVTIVKRRTIWHLTTDSESMMFFRTESHQFQKLEIFKSQCERSLSLLFQGHSHWPSVAIHFLLHDERQPQLSSAGEFEGRYQNQEDRDVEVKLKLEMEDKSGTQLSKSCKGKE